MPKKRYVLRKFAPGSNDNGRKSPNTLFSISSASINFAKDLTKSSLSLGVTETSEGNYDGLYTDILPNPKNAKSFSKYRDIVSVSGEFIAFFNKSYPLRRDYLRQFAQNGEINFVLETIADETIVYDSNNYFASLLRALGNSKTPLVFLAIAAIINIVLDIFFITSLNLNVAGAALATIRRYGNRRNPRPLFPRPCSRMDS